MVVAGVEKLPNQYDTGRGLLHGAAKSSSKPADRKSWPPGSRDRSDRPARDEFRADKRLAAVFPTLRQVFSASRTLK
jgi:hypothetical protein